VFTTVLHQTLSWARSNLYIPPHPISLTSILTLSNHLLLGHPSSPFLSGFPINILYENDRPLHPHWLITHPVLGEECKLWSFSLFSFLYPPVTSSLFGPNILLSTLFSNTLSYSFIPSHLALQLYMRCDLLNNWLPSISILCSPFPIISYHCLDAFHYINHPLFNWSWGY
jgi:hypothetical protein